MVTSEALSMLNNSVLLCFLKLFSADRCIDFSGLSFDRYVDEAREKLPPRDPGFGRQNFGSNQRQDSWQDQVIMFYFYFFYFYLFFTLG